MSTDTHYLSPIKISIWSPTHASTPIAPFNPTLQGHLPWISSQWHVSPSFFSKAMCQVSVRNVSALKKCSTTAGHSLWLPVNYLSMERGTACSQIKSFLFTGPWWQYYIYIYIMTHLTSVSKSVNSKCSVVVQGAQILVNQKRNGRSLVQQGLSMPLKLKAMLIILNFTNHAANWS